MKKTFSILIALLCCIYIYAKDSGVPQYELKCAGIGVEGTFLIEVSVFMISGELPFTEYCSKVFLPLTNVVDIVQ